ncbi:MAG: nitrogenase iron-molybdenum cofactor biosynthesis protein NifN [Nitrospirota bacterium]|nr:nitrogenase iron-molybdenum cofactor biosynthesis protein NifN [Nitrospirota bacterium]
MARAVSIKKDVSVDPLKLSRPLGAAMALLGVAGAMPLLHGAQGCASFAKVFFTRHFREPAPIGTSALSEMPVILGGEENLRRALLKLSQKFHPSMIGVIATALSETRGEDVRGMLENFKSDHPEFKTPLVFANAPDFQGSLEDGFALMMEALVSGLITEDSALKPISGEKLLNVLPSAGFCPGDVDEIKGLIQAFGLTPIVLPDLSLGMDGSLSGGGFRPVVMDGTRLEELGKMPFARMTLALGKSVEGAAIRLQEGFGVPYRVFDSVTGLQATDRFVSGLIQLSGAKVPQKIQRDRERLLDTMLDAHFFTGGKKLSAALEPDELLAVAQLAKEAGMELQALIAPANGPALVAIEAEEVTIGDLGDLERMAAGSDLLVASARAARLAKRLDIPLFRIGMPVFDRVGGAMRSKVGYNGSAWLLADIANVLLELEEQKLEEREHHGVSHFGLEEVG